MQKLTDGDCLLSTKPEQILLEMSFILYNLFPLLKGFVPFAQEVDAKIAFWNTEEFPYYPNGLAVEMLLYQIDVSFISKDLIGEHNNYGFSLSRPSNSLIPASLTLDDL